LISSSGCTIKATLDITTDGTTEYLSSTTGKSWWTEDGLVKRGEQVRAFVGTNYNNLLQEMAQGQREYLYAFVTILGISSHQEPLFQRLVQAPYTLLAEIPVSQGDHELNRFIRQVQLLSVHGPGEMVNS
jgi:hypothetical protein